MKIKSQDYNKLVLLDNAVSQARVERLRSAMQDAGMEALLVTDNANKYFLTGRVFTGQVYVPLSGEVIYFIRRPLKLEGDGVVYVHKPEQIAETLGLNMPQSLGLELDISAYSTVERLKKVFTGAEIKNASPLLRQVRAVKDDTALELLRMSGKKQVYVYSRIPRLYKEGMSDIELQIEIERASRLEGCLGQFRISGDSMELYMGNVLAGDNSDNPSPYDFAMGGSGMDPSLPVGADGTLIKNGMTVMVDMNGDYTGYMTDMTRIYCVGPVENLPGQVRKAHECSIRIHRELVKMLVPGTEAKALWQRAEEIAREEGLHEYFMGHRQKAGFLGHGVGIEINELPVIAPRSRDIIAAGNTVALEPKFVIPGAGAVGIESTYFVHPDHVENLTPAPEAIIPFD
ncbi:MAG: Xaa-Pro peptidase family protein [Duncaniella sp.]|nr:Xaa-Pro peptidase family protein [Duncaniella sp.]